MEGAPRGSGSTLRSYNPFSEQTTASSSADAANPRSPPSRRRRFMGRLARSGSDPRNITYTSTLNPEVPGFVPDTLKMPSKRKASSSAKAGKSIPSSSYTDYATTSSTDPPIISTDEILLARDTTRSIPMPNIRELVDSSDEDADTVAYATLDPATHRQGPRFQFGGSPRAERIRMLQETKKRQGGARHTSAILVSTEMAYGDPAAVASGPGRVRYLPLCPIETLATENDLLTVLPSHCDFQQRLERAEYRSNVTWPVLELPVELFDLITTHLARDDVKTMRLVNREFEEKVSRSLFHTSVVPFNTEIYDMIDEDRKTVNRGPAPHLKGKGKAKANSQDHGESLAGPDGGGLQWQNAKEDKEGKVYKGHGLRVFQGFGPHIKRFGMSFEISETQLSQPPVKKQLDHVQSYHGSYDWPSENYARFATLAGLENAADETSRMKAAFSYLEIVQELALSVDSGLGWLNGPDRSLHGTIFEHSSPVFGSTYRIPDRTTQAAREFWSALQHSYQSFDSQSNLKETQLLYNPLPFNVAELGGLRGSIYADTNLWSAIDRNRLSALPNNPYGSGVLYNTANQQTSETPYRHVLMPGDLSKEQREWLLETQWAQQAFLESYMLAVIDNPITFHYVTTLNIAKLSSRFLSMLAREVFWEALTHLSEVVLHVSADWRSVDKDDAGFAQTTNKYPSEAVRVLYREILQRRISTKESIKKLDIGWAGGGEDAEGLFARNANILPAPITQLDHCTANSSVLGIVFPHVEHLTLSNCWITPPALEGLVKSHSSRALKKLTLNSVSLTAHPKFPATAHGAAAQNIAQAMAAMQAQFANNGPALMQQQGFAVPPGALNAPGMNAQQMAFMQNQWNQQIQHFVHHGAAIPNGPVNPVAQFAAPANVPANPINVQTGGQSNTHWSAGHREGSWPQLIDSISPATVFDDYLPPPAPWEEQLPPRPDTNLCTVEFKSCGYAKLPNHTGFDQLVLEPVAHRHSLSQWFRARHVSLKPAMMSTSDRNIGQIVQYMPLRELDALQFGWGLLEGWQDPVKAEEPEFDGLLPGGTGRFSGVLQKGMALVGQPDDVIPSTAGAS